MDKIKAEPLEDDQIERLLKYKLKKSDFPENKNILASKE